MVKDFKMGGKAIHKPFIKPLFVGLFAALLILPFQGSRGLWEPDEGRYTCIAIQMLRTGDFLKPAFNDEVPHFAKPPLTCWAIAGGIALFGRNEWGARLANALAFVAAVVVVYAMGKTFTPFRPWLPALVYATFPVPFLAANMVTTDTQLALWEGIAVLGFVRWRENGEKRRAWLYLMWASFGMAFLTKGPPGLLPLIAILFFVLLADGRRLVSRLVSLWGLLIFAGVGLGWYAVVTARHPDLLPYFIRDEFLGRMGTGVHHRNPEWYKPFLIYIPVLIGGTLPYTHFLLRTLPSTSQTLLSRKWWSKSLAGNWHTPFLALWFFVPFVIFWASRSRLPLYVLPLFMPLALAVGRLVEHRRLGRSSICLLIAWILCLFVAKWGMGHYPYQKDSRPLAHAIASTVDPIPEEVLFLNTEAFWGVSLYLGCEVEEVVSVSTAKLRDSSLETLANELADEETGTLIVAPKGNAKRVLAILDHLGYEGKILGEFQRWVFISPGSDLTTGQVNHSESVYR